MIKQEIYEILLIGTSNLYTIYIPSGKFFDKMAGANRDFHGWRLERIISLSGMIDFCVFDVRNSKLHSLAFMSTDDILTAGAEEVKHELELDGSMIN